jgi:hypothetical protein
MQGQSKNRYILDEIYENLLKLENDLNQDFIIEDFLDLQRPELLQV